MTPSYCYLRWSMPNAHAHAQAHAHCPLPMPMLNKVASTLTRVLIVFRKCLIYITHLLSHQVTKGNANLQKIVAFENAFDKLFEIMEAEGWTDGGIVVEDCLRLLLNLLRYRLVLTKLIVQITTSLPPCLLASLLHASLLPTQE